MVCIEEIDIALMHANKYKKIRQKKVALVGNDRKCSCAYFYYASYLQFYKHAVRCITLPSMFFLTVNKFLSM